MPAIKLSDSDKRAFARIYSKYPEYSDALDEIIVETGFEAFDPYEYTPINIKDEASAFSEGFQSSATLGTAAELDVSNAGDVEVPYFGEVQPSRIAGNIAGGLIPGLGAYGLAGKAAKGMGMVKGGITVGVADKAKKLSMGGKVFQVVSAEAVPGALQGWVQSDGDIDEVIKMAAIWTSAGLLLEGTGTLAMRGWKKIRDGKKLTVDEQTAVNETGRVYKEQAEEAGIPQDHDTVQQEVDRGVTFSSLVGRLPGLSKWADTIRGETVGSAVVNDEARASILFAFRQGFLPNGTRIDADTPGGQDQLWTAIHENVESVKQVDAIRNGVEVIEEAYKNNDLTAPIQGTELLDLYLHGQLKLDELSKLVRQDIPAAQTDLGATPGGSAGAQKVVWSMDNLEKKVSAIHKKAFRSDKGAMRGEKGQYEKRVLDQEATQDQTARLSELVTQINHSLERINEPMIESAIMNKVLDSRNSMIKARQMETFLRSQVYQIDLRAREQAHSSILREDINPIRIQEMETENATKGWKAAFARTKGWQSEKSFKENIKEIREALVKQRTRFKVDPEGKYWKPIITGVSGEGVGYKPKTDPQVDIFKDLGLPWFLKVVPPYARWGLGSHPLTKQGVEYGMNMFEEIGKLKMDWIKRYQQAVAPLGAGNKQQALAALGRRGAKEAVEEEIRRKNLLTQALNGENVNEILKQNADLVPIYNQVRGLLDEAGDHIGLGFDKSGYLKDYFPHIFDGTTGNYRARRLSMEIGKRIGKVTRFLDDRTVDSIPALKHFSSKKPREANAEGYNMDLDAVMYTYLSGAAEMPFFNKFLNMSQGVVDRLPKRDVSGKEMALRGQYANWVNYVVGRPSDWKDTWANWWRNNDLFNRNVDHMVELIGDAETKGLMTLLRGKTIGKGEPRELEKGGFTFSKEQENQAIDWFDGLIREADTQTADGKLKGMSVKQFRARLALKIDDIRAGLSNPHARPVIIESMYRTLVVAKLGLSVSHGVINLTQTLVDAMPILGVKGVARGVSRYVGNKQAKFSNDVTVENVLNESGILSDIPEAREFTPSSGLGILSDLEEVAMAPARLSENFNRGVAFLGKYEKSIADGMEHAAAVIDARRFVQKVHFPFNRAGTIPLFHSPAARFLLMFKSYALHQMNFSAELLENAIVDGDVGPLAKHLLAYAALGSAASLAAGGGASNLPLQVGHPIEDFTPTNLANRGVLRTVGGPPADMLIDMMHGNYMSAIESYDYTALKRMREAASEEEAPKALLTGLGFR